MRFGEIYIHQHKLSMLGKWAWFVHGYPFIGGYIRSLYFKKYVRHLSFKTVLDAGCGNGEYAFYIADKYPRVYVEACDIREVGEYIELKDKFGFNNLKFFTADISTFNTKKKYDLIICMDVLEHIGEVENTLRNLYNCLRNNGYLMLHMPEKNWHRINIFDKNLFREHNRFVRKEHPGQKYTFDSMKKCLSGFGLNIVAEKYTFGFYGKLSWELDQLLREYKLVRLRTILLPFLKLLGLIDVYMTNKKGCGIFLLARKDKDTVEEIASRTRRPT